MGRWGPRRKRQWRVAMGADLTAVGAVPAAVRATSKSTMPHRVPRARAERRRRRRRSAAVCEW
jgi:hypothetical protein